MDHFSAVFKVGLEMGGEEASETGISGRGRKH
jgi:hypothetical protein